MTSDPNNWNLCCVHINKTKALLAARSVPSNRALRYTRRLLTFPVRLPTGEVGNASKMNLVLQLMTGVSLAGLAEGMALADRSGLQQKDVLEVLGLTTLACPLLLEKGRGESTRDALYRSSAGAPAWGGEVKRMRREEVGWQRVT